MVSTTLLVGSRPTDVQSTGACLARTSQSVPGGVRRRLRPPLDGDRPHLCGDRPRVPTASVWGPAAGTVMDPKDPLQVVVDLEESVSVQKETSKEVIFPFLLKGDFKLSSLFGDCFVTPREGRGP